MDELYKRLSDVPLKRRSGVALGVAIFACILWYFLGVRPIEAEIISMTDRIRAIERQLQFEQETNSKTSFSGDMVGHVNTTTGRGKT